MAKNNGLETEPQDLIDFPCSDTFIDAYREVGCTPRTAGRYQRTPRPEISDLITQHNVLSDGEFFRAILARSREEAFESHPIQAPSVSIPIGQRAILDELREIKIVLHGLPSPRQVLKQLPTPHPKENAETWAFTGVPDASA